MLIIGTNLFFGVANRPAQSQPKSHIMLHKNGSLLETLDNDFDYRSGENMFQRPWSLKIKLAPQIHKTEASTLENEIVDLKPPNLKRTYYEEGINGKL